MSIKNRTEMIDIKKVYKKNILKKMYKKDIKSPI